MNPLHEVDPQTLRLPQLLLLLVFIAAYVTAIGRMLGPRGRARAAALAALAAIGLCATLQPWTKGVLLIAGSVAAVGAYVLAAMLLSRGLDAFQPRVRSAPAAQAATAPGAAWRLRAQARRQLRRLVRQFSS